MEKKNLSIIGLLERELQLRNYSFRTVHTYVELVKRTENHLGIPFDKITTDQYKNYIHQRITKDGVSTSTVNQMLSVYKIVQVDLLKRDWESIKIKRPRRNKKLPVVLSQAEVEKLINAASNIKHRAILMLAYGSGLRRQETQMIKAGAIDSERMQVHIVQGKGKKDRYSILPHKALTILRQYYRLERPSCYLFEPQGKKSKHMSEQALNSLVKKAAVKAGIKKQISFHTLRHCFATHLLENGVNLRIIQQFLGHTSLKTTAVYLHLANIAPGSISSPLDKLDV
ncbi:MAG: tyrosine-type recombinase/integrase [Bacteroidales bacterium]|nr:tyrosine-type recombinase/integrase [Bacteroidales bacterium]